jgi:acyl carrier protein
MTVLNAPELEQRVARVVGGVLDADLSRQDKDQSLAETPGLEYDSATVVEAVVAVESEFEVEIDFAEDDIRYAFRSLGTIAELVEQKLSDKEALAR